MSKLESNADFHREVERRFKLTAVRSGVNPSEMCVSVCVWWGIKIHFLAKTHPLFCFHHLPHLFMLIYAVGGSLVYEPQRAAHK